MDKFFITLFAILIGLAIYIISPIIPKFIQDTQRSICENIDILCSETDSKEISKLDGIYYKKFTDTPYTGKVIGHEKGYINEGKRDGAWVTYDDNGKISSKGNYNNGVKKGSWIEDSIWTTVYKDGKLFTKGKIINGKKQGLWKQYYSSGVINFTTEYSNGVKNGSWLSYHNNGKLKSLGTYKNDKKNGYWETYNKYGKIDKYKDYWRDGSLRATVKSNP